jgi:hypothetical protein
MGRLGRLSVLVLVLLLGVGAARAQQPDPPAPPPPMPDIVGENFLRFLKGLRRLVEQVPLYEAPRVTPEGDIILRRIRPPSAVPEGDEARIAHEHDGVDL